MKLSKLSAAYVALATLAMTACDGNGKLIDTTLGPSHIGGVTSLVIVTVSSGLVEDPDGYTCYLDGQEGVQRMQANDTHYIAPVLAGRHEVELGDIAAGCQVIGSNPVLVDAVDNDQTEVVFEVECEFIPE
jgi:hypothetical protein